MTQSHSSHTSIRVYSPAKWNVLSVIWVPGSPIEWAPTAPTVDPDRTQLTSWSTDSAMSTWSTYCSVLQCMSLPLVLLVINKNCMHLFRYESSTPHHLKEVPYHPSIPHTWMYALDFILWNDLLYECIELSLSQTLKTCHTMWNSRVTLLCFESIESQLYIYISATYSHPLDSHFHTCHVFTH